jgi:hypothetical protein
MKKIRNMRNGSNKNKNSGSLEGSNKSEKPLFIRSKIMGIN